MKTCSKCGERLSIDNFNKCKSHKDGLTSWCRKCDSEYKKLYYAINKKKIVEQVRIYQEENKVKVAEYQQKYYEDRKENLTENQRKYYKDNKESIAEYKKIYQEDNKEKLSQYKRIYRKVNKAKISELNKAYYKENKGKVAERAKIHYGKNKDKITEYKRIWGRDNPDKRRASRQRRRANKMNLESTLTLEQWEYIKTMFNNKCAYCGQEKPLAQEHFLALSKGGEYTHNNIIPSCISCNSSKGTKSFFEWYPKHKHYAKKREKLILDYLGYHNDNQQLSIL